MTVCLMALSILVMQSGEAVKVSRHGLDRTMEADGKSGFVCFGSWRIQVVLVTAAGMASNVVGKFRVAAENLSIFGVLMTFV